MTGRIGIGKKLRFEVFKRDGFICQYCGRNPNQVELQCDHINPVALGGDNDIDNLITACIDCNLGKGATPLTSRPKSLAERAAEIAEREEQIAAYGAIMEAKRERLEDEMWRVATALRSDAEAGYPKAKIQSIKTFLARLGVHDVLEAAELASGRYPYSEARAFKYFCGICWNKIRDAE